MKTLTSISLILLSIIVVATALPAMDMRSPKLNTDPEKEIDVHSLAVSARQEGQSQCLTASNSNDPRTPCHFPFTYGGKTYNECLLDVSYYWCATEAEYRADKWGYCPDNCPPMNQEDPNCQDELPSDWKPDVEFIEGVPCGLFDCNIISSLPTDTSSCATSFSHFFLPCVESTTGLVKEFCKKSCSNCDPCFADPCNQNGATGEVCDAGKCNCGADQCAGGQICNAGVCVTCNVDGDCATNEVCTNGGTTTSACGCQEVCTEDYTPVCGTNRQTYSNSCNLMMTACTTGNDQLTVASEGECPSLCTGTSHNRFDGTVGAGNRCVAPCVNEFGSWGSTWCYTKEDKSQWGADCSLCSGIDCAPDLPGGRGKACPPGFFCLHLNDDDPDGYIRYCVYELNY